MIEVRRDDLVKGSPENPWAEVWPEFSSAIKKAVGDETHSLILCDFSTTGLTERAASEVARLVDAFSTGGYAPVSLVAEVNRQVIGHIMFSDLNIITDAGTVAALAIAPMAVLPNCHKQGIGSALVRGGLDGPQNRVFLTGVGAWLITL